jgi:glucose-6-phosphate isomerase
MRRSESTAARVLAGVRTNDPGVWSQDPAVQEKIGARLGWLRSPMAMVQAVGRLNAFADGIRRGGFTDIVLLGMGGSSLAPEVVRRVLGSRTGFPRFQVLDSTDPAAVRAAATPPARTLYILASKSGTTIEPNAMAAHFRASLIDSGIEAWSRHFVAITDEETALARRARSEGFRELFINPSDIGGRYSALSFFGLVPAALMGQPLESMLSGGVAMLDVAREVADVPANPAVGLGLLLAAGTRAGRDKLTLILPSDLDALGLWIEQLVAESTGKRGIGIVPVVGEPAVDAERYGSDRMFVSAGHRREESLPGPGASIETDASAGALGAEFMRWEIATAAAGAILEINPFDEPNVQQAKDATNVLIEAYRREGSLPQPPADQSLDGITLTLSRAARERLPRLGVHRFLSLIGPNDYFALLAYLGPDRALGEALMAFRAAVRDRTRAATTVGYGPRYLHSTGQLHKGGPNAGVYAIVTAAPVRDLPVPGHGLTFGTLELAQALGDFQSLDELGRRILHVHLPAPDPKLIRAVAGALLDTAP